MEIDVIKNIIKLLEQSNLKKIYLKEGDFEISIERDAHPHPAKVPCKKVKETIEKETLQDEGDYILSPMVGTFYASPSPDSPSFVKIGDEVGKDTVIGIIEAMKVMNEIKAGKSGLVKELLVENAQPVEFGTKLIRLDV